MAQLGQSYLGQFDGYEPPLVASTVFGSRGWQIDQWGRLRPLHSGGNGRWRPGWNKATCGQNHQHAALHESCGFYAYFDSDSNQVNSGADITGIIEGKGRVTVGSGGFRAEQARIVALVIPEPKREWSFVPRRGPLRWFIEKVNDEGYVGIPALVAMFMGTMILGIAASTWGWSWWWPVLNFVVAGFLVCCTLTPIPENSKPDPTYDLVRAAYPEVPIFTSMKAAQRQFPLTKPITPPVEFGPEDDRFWDRQDPYSPTPGDIAREGGKGGRPGGVGEMVAGHDGVLTYRWTHTISD